MRRCRRHVPGRCRGTASGNASESKGSRKLGAVTTGIVAFFGNVFVASVVGVLVGASALALTKAGVGMFTPETLELGAARAVVLMLLGLVGTFVGLLLYYLFAREGLVPFGFGMIAGFLIPTFVALFRSV